MKLLIKNHNTETWYTKHKSAKIDTLNFADACIENHQFSPWHYQKAKQERGLHTSKFQHDDKILYDGFVQSWLFDSKIGHKYDWACIWDGNMYHYANFRKFLFVESEF